MSTVNNNVGAIIFKCCSDCFYLLSQVHCNVFLPQICKARDIFFSLCNFNLEFELDWKPSVISLLVYGDP